MFSRTKADLRKLLKEVGIFHLTKCHLCVPPDSPCQTPSNSTDPKPHPASSSHGNRQHIGDHLLKLSFRGKEKPQTAAL